MGISACDPAGSVLCSSPAASAAATAHRGRAGHGHSPGPARLLPAPPPCGLVPSKALV